MNLRRFVPLRLLEEGGRFPFGWGLAWRDWERGRAVIMPWPLNLVVRASFELRLLLTHGWRRGERVRELEGWRLRELRDAYRRGYSHGVRGLPCAVSGRNRWLPLANVDPDEETAS